MSKKNINLLYNENNVPSENVESMININCDVMCIFSKPNTVLWGDRKILDIREKKKRQLKSFLTVKVRHSLLKIIFFPDISFH